MAELMFDGILAALFIYFVLWPKMWEKEERSPWMPVYGSDAGAQGGRDG